MLVAIQAFNNIRSHKLLTAYHGILSDSYRDQTINDLEKLLDLKGEENITKITAPIFMVLGIHIRLTRILEDSGSSTK